MALEERVKAVEDEVNILKDQIRNTLLEIQEQILLHYYPDLRAQESSPLDLAAPVARRNGSSGKGSPRNRPSFSGVQRVTLEEAQPTLVADPDQSAGEPLASGQTAKPLPAASATTHEEATAPAPERLSPPPQPNGSSNWASVTRLMEWADDSVERIGKERTAKAIEISTKGGYLAPGVKDTLLQLIALSDEEPPVGRVSLRAIHDTLLKLSQALGQDADVAALDRLMEEAQVG